MFTRTFSRQSAREVVTEATLGPRRRSKLPRAVPRTVVVVVVVDVREIVRSLAGLARSAKIKRRLPGRD